MLHISPCVDFYFSLTDNPYLRLITENGSTMDYLIQKDKSGRQAVVHHDKLKKYEGVHKPRWVNKALNNKQTKPKTST